MKDLKFYGASKVWHSPLWKAVRADGFAVTSRWIDYENGSFFVEQCKDQLWQHCLEDVTKADCVIIYCGDPSEEQRGVVMEAGHAIGQGKPVYCINHCATFSACEISDVAFTHHKLWNWVNPNEWLSFEDGFRRAIWKAANDQFLATENQLRFAAKKGA